MAYEFFIALSIGIVAGIFAGYIVKYSVKSRRDTVFDNNHKNIVDIVFSNVTLIESCHQRIQNYLKDTKPYKDSKTIVVVAPETFKEIMKDIQGILDGIDTLTLYKDSTYLIYDDYLVIQQFSWSAYSHFYKIYDVKYGIGTDKIALEHLRYYAKLIIERFKKLTPKEFKKHWKAEFDKVGGSKCVIEPVGQPGDRVGPYLNIDNAILHYDAKYAKMMKLLDEVIDNTENLKKDSGE